MKKSKILSVFMFSLFVVNSSLAAKGELENIDIYILPEGLAFRKPISEEELIKYSCGYRSNDKLVVEGVEKLLQKNELSQKASDVSPLYYFMKINVANGSNSKEIIFGEKPDGVVIGKMPNGSRGGKKIEYGRTLEQHIRHFISERHLSLFQNPSNQSNC